MPYILQEIEWHKKSKYSHALGRDTVHVDKVFLWLSQAHSSASHAATAFRQPVARVCCLLCLFTQSVLWQYGTDMHKGSRCIVSFPPRNLLTIAYHM